MNRKEPTMQQLDRRSLFAALAALGAAGALAGAAKAENTTAELSVSKVIPFASLNPVQLPTGSTIRRVMSGTLPTGEFIEVHESVLPAGHMPHATHKHPNTEMLFIQAGKLEYIDVDKPIPVGPGDIVFSASNVPHGLRNIGDTPASYIVVSVGKMLPEG
jgi:XRE family transcriptional regulator, regulator of sulfur utilization